MLSHELGDFLDLLDLGIGEGAVVDLHAGAKEERGRRAAARRGHDEAEIVFAEELPEVNETGLGA